MVPHRVVGAGSAMIRRLVSLRLLEDVYTRLVALAAREHRSIGMMAALLIERALRAEEKAR